MARHYISGSRTKTGERLFYSDRDGDSKNSQTVYRKTSGGSHKVKSRYNPSKRKFF